MEKNCYFDKNKKTFIPQNKNNEFFIIEKSKSWNYSIDIVFNINSPINYLNLFIILKSYLSYKIINPVAIAMICQTDQHTLVTKKLRSELILKTTLNEFENWINFKINYDARYITTETFYSFRLLYHPSLVTHLSNKYNIDLLQFLKPLFPWSEKILNEISDIENKELIINEKLNQQKLTILKLQNDIKKKTHPYRNDKKHNKI